MPLFCAPRIPRIPLFSSALPWNCRVRPDPGQPDSPQHHVVPAPGPAAIEDPPLSCVACRAPITTESRRITVAGDHRHVFANPHGLVFVIGCFSLAPGCIGTGTATTDFSWFADTTWQTALCGVCRLHLGWLYHTATGGFFYGLILDRLLSGPIRTGE